LAHYFLFHSRFDICLLIMLFLLFAVTFATDMCVVKKIFDDSSCTTATATADVDYSLLYGYKSLVCTEVQSLGYYAYANCTNDNDIKIYSLCDTDACDSGTFCSRDYQYDNTCKAPTDYNVGKYEKFVCEPCDQVDCQVDARDGMDLNPTCTPVTGAPVAGEHCVQRRYWEDRECTRVNTERSDKLLDGTCRGKDLVDYGFKGTCTKDADGNMVTGTVWELCDTNSCDDGADATSCPTAGKNIIGDADCKALITGGYATYECVPCDAPVCDNDPQLSDSFNTVTQCGSASSTSSLMMIFATLAAALLF